jgi:hypothetical protein
LPRLSADIGARYEIRIALRIFSERKRRHLRRRV